MLWADGKTLYKKVTITRLGSHLAESGMLSEESMARSVNAIGEFCNEAQRERAKVYAFATAAVRSAKNGDLFCNSVKDVCGISVEVISGTNEARLACLGALGEKDGGIIDIGGASTEVCFCRKGETVFSVSMNVGAVRLYDICKDDPKKLKAEVALAITPLEGVKLAGDIYAVGGTASTLTAVKLGAAEYDSARMNHVPLERAWVEETADKLLKMTKEERECVAGMDVSRADVIAGAAYLLAEIMKKLSCFEVLFSDSDNLEGYLTFRGLR